MRLRDFQPADLDAVLRLNTEALEPTADIDASARRSPDLLLIEEVYQAGGAFLVGEEDGEVIAMGAIRLDRDNTFEMKRIRVALAHQRRGHAMALINELERQAALLGGTEIILDTTEEQVAAQKLYERLGYALTHRSVLEWPERTFQLVHYRKDLRQPAQRGEHL